MSAVRLGPRIRPFVADTTVAVGVAAVSIAGNAVLAHGQPVDPLADVLLAAAALPLVSRRERPVAVLALALAGAFLYSLLDLPGGMYTLPIGIALYSAVDAGRRREALAGAAAAVGGLLAIGVLLGRGHIVDLTNAGWFAGWLVAALVLGEVTRGRRAYLEQVEQRALEAERTREEEARRRAGEERIRIARELHDVLAHRISSISVQSGVGLHLLERDPAQARAALIAINDASREALRELRSTLGVLRQADEPPPRAPAAGLDRLPEVVATACAAGLDVQLDLRGESRELPASVDLAAFRIVQESLTNVVRHAGAAHARVAITLGRDAVDVQVEDDGHGVDPGWGGAGHGLLGMRERAAALGGQLVAGPRAEGGFSVSAHLPIGAS